MTSLALQPWLSTQRRRRDFYDLDTSHWKLTGAARPAASLPGAGGAELPCDRDPWVPGEDLFEKLGGGGKASASKGRFYDGPEPCREYLGEQLPTSVFDAQLFRMSTYPLKATCCSGRTRGFLLEEVKDRSRVRSCLFWIDSTFPLRCEPPARSGAALRRERIEGAGGAVPL